VVADSRSGVRRADQQRLQPGAGLDEQSKKTTDVSDPIYNAYSPPGPKGSTSFPLRPLDQPYLDRFEARFVVQKSACRSGRAAADGSCRSPPRDVDRRATTGQEGRREEDADTKDKTR